MTAALAETSNSENRVLVLMPTGRDASLVCQMLEKASISAFSCANANELENEIQQGAGAILLAEEALSIIALEQLIESLETQPVWSDIPLIFFASNTENSERLLEQLGARLNATIVERPIRVIMLISAVRGALRARERQYQARNLLNQLEESDRQKDLFLATLSHELRTPLNSILGWIQVINSAKSTAVAVDVNHALAVIERNARAQSEIISDILLISRVITGKLTVNLEPIDLIGVIRAAIETVRPSFEEKQIQIHLQLEAETFQIKGDADRLQQVFWNLLSNAVKFTPERGRIDVRVSGEDSVVKVEIRDSGQGIKPEFLPHVFERFRQADSSYTRNVGGLGLGLAIVKHLVTLHDGSVSVSSEGENRGSVFTVMLPVFTEMRTETDSTQRASSPAIQKAVLTNKLRILLVEDDEDSREMLKLMFEKHGMQVTSVSSAADALTEIKTLFPDVLISDIGLPNEDGYSLIRRVRNLSPEQGGLTPAIALTGYVSLQDRSHALDIGYQEHLSKPVNIDELLRVVQNLATNNR